MYNKGHTELMFKDSHWRAFRILPNLHGGKTVRTYKADGDVVYWNAKEFTAEWGDDYLFEASALNEEHIESTAASEASKAIAAWRRQAFTDGYSPEW